MSYLEELHKLLLLSDFAAKKASVILNIADIKFIKILRK